MERWGRANQQNHYTSQRNWLKSIFTEINVAHELFYLKVSDATCLQQIARRREEIPARAATDTEEMFHQVTQFFVEPTADEGFNMTTVERGNQ